MAISRKRKQSVDIATPDKQSNGQKGIQTFGGISKSHVVDDVSKKQKIVHQRQATPQAAEETPVATGKGDRKRKRQLDAIAEEDDNDDDDECQPSTERPNSRVFKQFGATKAATPRNKRFKNALPPSPKDTPTKGTLSLFDKLNLRSSSPSIPSSPTKQHTAYDTPPLTPDEESLASEPDLPAPLSDLYNLNAAFLSALSLYYAHNGTSSSVDVEMLLPMITRSWKRRAVTLDDLRRILAVGERAYTLEDRGRAGLSLCPIQPRGRTIKRSASFIDERTQNVRFEQALTKSFVHWQAKTAIENREPNRFVAELPLADIIQTESTQQVAPIFARGQQRLADLKAGQAAARAEKPIPTTLQKSSQSTTPTSRGTSLLDRILAKQAHAASLPSGPSKTELDRKTALHRVEEVSRVLELLASGRPRASFSMQAVVQHLQQSLRSPISREEAERCLELMAGEVCPGFVKVVKGASVSGVLVTKGGRVGPGELTERLKGLGL
ncbi:hypothetical protein MBLNU230_g3871t1 [Neophaeotheca triangularis]